MRRAQGGGGLVQQLRKSYSLSDLVEDTRPAGGGSGDDAPDEADDVLADPRLIRQSIARSGYNTRRSASESNNRTPIYFSEVDVDVRSTRASTRGDVPDFSHIKSSEDISSGYSSADNSGALREGAAGGGGGSGEGAGLARAGSVGAAARPRTRLATRTVTTIKRPGAAEGSEVVIEELEDNENFDFTDLPPLLNLPSSYHISQTNPPFLFEYVGNQIKIVRMLGDVLPSNAPENNTVRISQNENPVIESCSYKTSMIGGKADFNNKIEAIPENSPIDFPKVIIPIYDRTVKDDVDTNKNDNVVIIEKCLPFVPSSTIEAETIRTSELNELNDTFNHNVECINNSNLMLHCQHSKSVSSSSASLNSAKTTPSVGKDNSGGDGESIETSSLDDIIETDDEGSYGTPENSPRAINKHKKKGKYGKSRAPPPPDVKDDLNEVVLRPINDFSSIKSNDIAEVSISESSYNVKSSEVSSSHGHISKRKYRQKSKSPTGRKFKLSSSPITRLMQLPGKLAFWHKSEDKFKSDTWSTSSDDLNGRSLVGENVGDEFQSCVDLQEATNKAEAGDSGPNEHIPTITVSASLDKHPEETVTNITVSDFDLEESAIAKDIIDKSDVLQKLIEAKLESHPEYKIVPLHGEEIQTTSKSTEV